MKHIIIPTDLTIPSLNAVHAAVDNYPDTKLCITLFHLLRMPDDIPSLLFRSMRYKHLQLITDDFKEACEILQNRYSTSLEKLHIKFGFGSTAAYLRNVLEGERADGIFICPDIQLGLPSAQSVEMTTLLKRTGLPLDIAPSKSQRHALDLKAFNMTTGGELKEVKELKIREAYAIEE